MFQFWLGNWWYNFHNIPEVSPDFVQQLYQGLGVLATRNGKNNQKCKKLVVQVAEYIQLHYTWWMQIGEMKTNQKDQNKASPFGVVYKWRLIVHLKPNDNPPNLM